MARIKVKKQPYYMGEVIRAKCGGGYQMYDVISVDKSTWRYPGEWDIVIKSKVDGEHYNFYLDGDDNLWELIQPVEERLWNL
jgi:hypothetical protein